MAERHHLKRGLWVLLALLLMSIGGMYGVLAWKGGRARNTLDWARDIFTAPSLPEQKSIDAAQLELELLRVTDDLHARLKAYEASLHAHYDALVQQVPAADAINEMERARAGAAFLVTADGLCNWKTCGTLAYKMAYDMVKGTTRFDEALTFRLEEHILAPILAAMEVYRRQLETYQSEMLASTRAFETDCLLSCTAFEDKLQGLTVVDLEQLAEATQHIEAFKAQVRDLAVRSVTLQASALSEAFLMPAMLTTLRSVAVLTLRPMFVGAAGRLTGVATTAASAMIDGPLPIGDIVGCAIGVGGTIWTAYELYYVMQKMPVALRDSLMAYIDDVEANLSETTCSHAMRLRDELLKNATLQMTELVKELEM